MRNFDDSRAMEQNHIANECWNFELWRYEQVGDAVLLLCAWLGIKGRALSEADIREAIASIAPWRATIVECIRRVRRNFRGASVARDPALPLSTILKNFCYKTPLRFKLDY